MFVRYLGGGIGHLEQFPPADGDAGTNNNNNVEIETDDFILGDHGDEGGRDREVGENEDEENEEEEEESEGEEGDDPGESSDEETGNVY